jgi:hypothetical protein
MADRLDQPIYRSTKQSFPILRDQPIPKVTVVYRFDPDFNRSRA